MLYKSSSVSAHTHTHTHTNTHCCVRTRRRVYLFRNGSAFAAKRLPLQLRRQARRLPAYCTLRIRQRVRARCPSLRSSQSLDYANATTLYAIQWPPALATLANKRLAQSGRAKETGPRPGTGTRAREGASENKAPSFVIKVSARQNGTAKKKRKQIWHNCWGAPFRATHCDRTDGRTDGRTDALMDRRNETERTGWNEHKALTPWTSTSQHRVYKIYINILTYIYI